MGQAPSDYTVQQVVSQEDWDGDNEKMRTYELILAEVPGRTLKAVVPAAGPPMQEGPVKGWLDLSKGKLGIAKDRPQGSRTPSGQSNGAGRTDATGRSIERQVAAKVAGELMSSAGYNKATFAQDFRFYTDAIFDAIRGEDDPDAQVQF